jgi:hypothetical protein
MLNLTESVLRLLAIQLYRVLQELQDLWVVPQTFKLSYLERLLWLHRQRRALEAAFYKCGIQCTTPLVGYASDIAHFLVAADRQRVSLVLAGNEIRPDIDYFLMVASAASVSK